MQQPRPSSPDRVDYLPGVVSRPDSGEIAMGIPLPLPRGTQFLTGCTTFDCSFRKSFAGTHHVA